MDQLRCMRIFFEVARRGSFYAAAQHFSISPASVTKHVAALEKALNVRLLNRTTKKVALTQQGRLLLESGSPLVERFDDLQSSVSATLKDISGTIRVGVPPTFGSRRFLPVITEFHRQYPNIHISLSFSASRYASQLGTEALDVNIVIVPHMKDSTQFAIPLGRAAQTLVASTDYLRRCPPLRTLEDLAHCNCLVNQLKSPTNHWRFTHNGTETSVRVSGTLSSDMGDVLKEAAIMGVGISMHPCYMTIEEIERGLLRVVLPSYIPTPLQVYAVYPSRERVPARVQKFLEFLSLWGKEPKRWSQDYLLT